MIYYATVSILIDINNKPTAMSIEEEMDGFPQTPFPSDFVT